MPVPLRWKLWAPRGRCPITWLWLDPCPCPCPWLDPCPCPCPCPWFWTCGWGWEGTEEFLSLPFALPDMLLSWDGIDGDWPLDTLNDVDNKLYLIIWLLFLSVAYVSLAHPSASTLPSYPLPLLLLYWSSLSSISSNSTSPSVLKSSKPSVSHLPLSLAPS